MDTTDKQQALADEILSDARRQAERAVTRAKRRGDSILKAARTHAGDAKQKAAEAAEAKAERNAATIMADVPYQEQVRTLGVKEDVIGQLFTESLDTLRALPPDEMLDVLAALSMEAISSIGGERFVIELSAEDAERLGPRLAARVGDVAVEIAASPEVAGGGVIVRSASGPKMVDNSFATRLRRCRESLRGRVAEMVFGDESE